jgi:hypothetical protein
LTETQVIHGGPPPTRKRCLAIIQLKSDSTIQRVAADVPKIVVVVRRFSQGEHEQAFRSNDGLQFGFFLNTNTPQFLLPEFEKCEGTQNGDALLVFEAGQLISGQGFSRAWTWLQRH